MGTSQNTVTPMRIGLVIASMELGGAQRMVLRLAAGLHERGHHVRLFCMDGGMAPALDGPDGVSVPARAMTRLSRGKSSMLLTKILRGPGQVRRLNRHVKNDGIEVLVSFMERSNIATLLTKKGPAKFISVRSHPEALLASKSPAKRRLISSLFPLLLHRASAAICNSADSADGLRRLFRAAENKTEVIHNFMFPEQISITAEEALAPADLALFDRPVIVSCGRLVSVKGHMQLLRAFAGMASMDDPRLVIVGGGPGEATLRNACGQLGIDDDVFFTGPRVNPLPFIKRASMFVLPSLREGFPNALVEAMALGVPVIASDCPGGVREILAPDTDPSFKTQVVHVADHGILTPAPDVANPRVTSELSRPELRLSEAMDMLMDNADLRDSLSQSAMKRVDDFRPQIILPQWEALFAKAIAEEKQ